MRLRSGRGNVTRVIRVAIRKRAPEIGFVHRALVKKSLRTAAVFVLPVKAIISVRAASAQRLVNAAPV